MKGFLFAMLLLTSINVSASKYPEHLSPPPYTLIYDSLDTTINESLAIFLFDLSQLDKFARASELVYSIDNRENLTYDYSNGDTLEILMDPGTHIFRFYAGDEYEETPYMQLAIEPQHRQLYQIHFSEALYLMPVRKPVIYLYPEETVDVSVEVNPVGNFTFTYPNINQGWNFTCHPNGTLQQGDVSYRYLFWESEQEIPTEIIPNNEGVVLSGFEAIDYLETQMKKFGMTSEECADFITYWGPILQTKSNLYIYLLFNEVCDAFASLEISPKPAEIGRFYVIWAAVPDDYNPSLESQQIPEMQRDGFTVLEWGGSEVDASKLLLEDL